MLAAATVGPLHAARADDPEADALIAKGVDLREKGKDDEALAVFKKAFAKSPTPRARAQVALAEQALGVWVAAEADLIAALAVTDDAWISKNRPPLEGALATVRRHLGSLEVRGTDGADVTLDGVKLGTLPATVPFRVEAGRRTLELHAKGFYPTTRSIEVPAGAVARETVQLVAMPPAEVTPPPPGQTQGPVKGPTEPHDTTDPGRTQRVVGWILTGTGAGLVITGGVGFLVRKGYIDDYNIDTNCPGQDAVKQPTSCQSKIDSAHTWLLVSVSTLIAGGVFAATGITLLATAPKNEASGPSRIRVGCAPSASGLFCSGTF